nr:zinc finger, CCHC-type [Tanacetum cinerariifolium]
MFQQQAKQELFEPIKAFHACKQEEGQSVSTYDYDQFVQNYNMHGIGKTIPELHAMLKLIENSIPKKAHVVLAIRQGQIQKPKPQARGKGKKRGKGKSKLAYDPKHKIPLPAKKEHPAKDIECHHCHKTGQWKRKCPLYLAELNENKASTSGTSGSIMYIVRCTRPDITFSQNLTSRYQQNPGESHWSATDASWETDQDDLRSQKGYVFVMNGGVVDWKSSKQSTTTMSSMEAEYIDAAEAVMEAIWIRKFISRLGIVPNNDKPIDMCCDNTCAITIAD